MNIASCLDLYHQFGHSSFIAIVNVNDVPDTVLGHVVLEQHSEPTFKSSKPTFRSEDCKNRGVDPESIDWEIW